MSGIHLSKNLVQQRRKAGISQEELANYLGVSKAAVSKWENEQSFPDILLLPELATYFNISVDELLGYEPQLSREEIRRQYVRFRDAFEKREFAEVLVECKEMIRKYYSCYPFLLQMAVLLMNYAVTMPERQDVMDYVLELLQKVRQESDDPNDAKDAISAEVLCYIMMNRAQDALALLDEDIRPISQETELLAQAYQGLGEMEKAEKALQVAMYQHLILLIGDGTSLLLSNMQNPKKADELMRRLDILADTFELDRLHPNVMASYYLVSAQVCCVNQQKERALAILKRYVDLCTRHFFPYELRGDSFFDRIDSWFQEFPLGIQAPRGEATIKKSLISGMCENPLFQQLRDSEQYLQLEKRLQTIL